MTYDALEKSVESGKPVELYKFTLGTEVFLFTSAEDTITVGLDVFNPEQISRGKLEKNESERDRVLNVTVPSLNAFAKKYVLSTPHQRALLTIQRFHRSDTPTPEVVSFFVGTVRSVGFSEDDKKATIAVLPLTSSKSRPMPRRGYQGLCGHVLYDLRCKVVETDPAFRLSSVVTMVSGNLLTVPGVSGFSSDFFKGGFVQHVATGDFRLVLDHSGDTLTLLLPFTTNVVGSDVIVQAGCDRRLVTCDSKFFTPEDPTSNVINYGGFPSVPTKNPFQVGLD